jgi:hypothetical protein
MLSRGFRWLSLAVCVAGSLTLLLSPANAQEETPIPTPTATPTSVPSPLPSAVGPEDLPPVDLAAPIVEPKVLAARFKQPAAVRGRPDPAPLPFTGQAEDLLMWTSVGLGLIGVGSRLIRRRKNAT